MRIFTVGVLLMAWGAFAQAVEVAALEQLIAKGDHQQALNKIDDALDKDKNNLALKTLQADALAAAGKTDQAINQYKALIKQHPQQAELYNNLAILLSNQGDYEAARDTLDKGLKTSKTYAVIYDNLSNVYMEMARDSYGKALQLGTQLQPLPLKKLAVKKAPAQVASNTAITKPVKPVVVAQASSVVAKKSQATKIKPAPKLVPAQAKPAAATAVSAVTARVNSSKQDVMDSLQGWAAAWSAQAPDLYLSFYHNQFSVPDGLDRGAWEAQRKQRLRKPKWIQVELDEMNVQMPDDQNALVTLVQAYRSNGYQDKTRKKIIMANTDNGWRITQERSLGRVK